MTTKQILRLLATCGMTSFEAMNYSRLKNGQAITIFARDHLIKKAQGVMSQ